MVAGDPGNTGDQGRASDQDKADDPGQMHGSTHSAPGPLPPADDCPPARPAVHRRRRRLVLAVLAGLVAVVYAAPYLLSTGPGCWLLIGIVNARSDVTVELADLRLTWLGPCTARGLRVTDRQGREVFTAGTISYSNGLLQAIRSPDVFDKLAAGSVTATLYLADGRGGLPAWLGEIRRAAGRGGNSPTTGPRGAVAVSDGRVRLVYPDAETYELRDLDAHIARDSRGELSGRVRFQPSGGGTLKASFSLSALSAPSAPTGELSDLADGDDAGPMGRANGRFSVATVGAVDLAPVGRLIGQAGLEGKASVTIDGKIRAGRVTAGVQADVNGLQFGSVARPAVRPTDLHLRGKVDVGDTLTVRLELAGRAGQVTVNVSSTMAGWSDAKPLPELLSGLLSGLLAGRTTGLPEFSVDLAGAVDLPALTESYPALVRLLPGVEVTSGRLTADDVVIRGGDVPSARGRFTLQDLSAVKDGRNISPGPIQLDLDISAPTGTGVNLDRLALSADFGRCDGVSGPDGLDVNFELDIQKLRDQLGSIFALGGDLSDGDLAGRVHLTFDQPDRIGAVVKIDVTGLVGRVGPVDGRPINIGQGSMNLAGYVLTRGRSQDRRPVEAVVQTGRIEIDRDISAAVSGRYDIASGAFALLVKAGRAGLPRIAALLARPGEDWPDGLGGTLEVDTSLARQGGESPIMVQGRLSVSGLMLKGKPFAGGKVALTWSDLAIGPGGRSVDAGKVVLTSALIGGEAKGLHVESENGAGLLAGGLSAKNLSAAKPSGEFDLSADLAGCIAGARLFKGGSALPAVSGTLTWRGRCTPTRSGLRLAGRAGVSDLQLADGGRTIRQRAVTVDHDILVDRAAGRAEIKQFKLLSDALSLDMSGTVTDLGGDWMLDLAGDYDGSWDDLLAVAEQFAPGLGRRVSLAGATGGRFSIRGPAKQRQAAPAFRGLVATSQFEWRQGRVMGVLLGEAKVAPTLRDGVVTIPATEIPAGPGGGMVRLAGRIDFTGREPTYLLPGRVMVLENLPITAQLGHDLLSRFNPIFSELTSVDGRISIELADLALPLGEELTHGGRGHGRLDLRALRVRPAGLLADLLAMEFATAAEHDDMQADDVDFVIRDGRIYYDSFRLTVAGDFVLEFYGSVGFDDTLDLAVSVPISSRVLDRLGVRGPVADYARVLAGARVAIPIVGTRLKPRLDFSEVDIGALIKQAAQMLLSEQAGDLLGEIFTGPPSGPAPSPAPSPAPQPAPPRQPDTRPTRQEPDLQPLLDSLLDLLKDSNE